MNPEKPAVQTATSASSHPQQDELADRISSALFQADTMCINIGSNTDEYDLEAESIVFGLKEAASTNEAHTVVHETFCRCFGPAEAGPRERYRPFASVIWSLWCERAQENAYMKREKWI